MNDQEQVGRGQAAKEFLGNPLWAEAWEAYRARLFDIIDAADSNATDAVMQAKRLLTAGKAARGYLERIIIDGKVSADTIKMDEMRKAKRAA